MKFWRRQSDCRSAEDEFFAFKDVVHQDEGNQTTGNLLMGHVQKQFKTSSTNSAICQRSE